MKIKFLFWQIWNTLAWSFWETTGFRKALQKFAYCDHLRDKNINVSSKLVVFVSKKKY